MAAAALALAPGASASGSGTISGVAFDDADRNGAFDPGESPFAGQVIYLLTAAGAFVEGASTDATGRYEFDGLADGGYTVEVGDYTWQPMRDQWVPTTTGSIVPSKAVTLAGDATVDFGWRPIRWSTDVDAPISSVVAPDGLTVASYNDAVAAAQVEAALRQGSLVGDEASTTTVRFAFESSSYCAMAGGGSPSATCYVSYRSWLDRGDTTLFHEYGHAWANFHASRSGDTDLISYLDARGLTDDTRLGSSHAWYPAELIAEDYRQLFGSANASSGPQENRDIPAAADVAGLREFLESAFRAGAAGEAEAPPSSGATTPATDVFVGDLDGSAAAAGGGRWTAGVAVATRDHTGAPVDGASVTLDWRSDGGRNAASGTVSCTTRSDGACTITQTLDKRQRAVTFHVRAVAASGRTYVPSANTDPDGDTTGTDVTVAKP